MIVMADSDIHAPADYLRRLASESGPDGVGLVTTLYTGLGASQTLAARLGAAQINHSFLPGALLARALGRQDCLGATMALRRETLEGVGGLHALVHHLADDAVLGRLVMCTGPDGGAGGHVAGDDRAGDAGEPSVRPRVALGTHHPVAGADRVRDVVLAVSAVLVRAGGRADGVPAVARSPCSWASWLARAAAMLGIDAAARPATAVPVWLLPLRDLLSVAVILASYGGNEVAWRGHVLRISPPRLAAGKG